MRATDRGAGGRAAARRGPRAVALLAIACAALGWTPRALGAQNQVSVPFTNGFIGTRGSSAGSAEGVKTFATLGIARLFFIQSSSTNQFELQGNDIPGTLRIVRTNGTTIDMPASANWRMNSGSHTDLVGILPRPTSPVALSYGAGSTLTITDGANTGGTSIGGYVAGYAGAVATDGSNQSGNAAKSQLLDGMNDYLATVVSSRPAGPVTVTAQSTTSTTPTIAGTATLGAGENLTVVVNGVQYSDDDVAGAPAQRRQLDARARVGAVGRHVRRHRDDHGRGRLHAERRDDERARGHRVGRHGHDRRQFHGERQDLRRHDGGDRSTAGLTLSGVAGGHTVTIASATLAFQSAAAGAAKTVTITGVTLGGAHAAQYTANLTGAPTATASVTAKALTITGLSASSRAYDGTTAATLTGTAAYSGLVAGEVFAVSGTPTAAFATAAVGTAKAVTVTGYAAPSANYGVTQPAGLTANVTAKTLGVGGSFTASSKVHDGTTAATIATNALTLVGVVGGDAVSLAGVAAAFADAAVGTGKAVSLTAASLAGAGAPNYTLDLAGAPTTVASITSAGGTVTVGGSFTASDKTYDGTTTATGTTASLTLSGVSGGDQVTIVSATFAFASAGAGAGKTVTITGVTLGGANGAQYGANLAGAPTATATVAAKALTISGLSASSKPYDGTTAATLAGTPAYAGLVAGETFAVSGTPTATFASAAAGTGKAVAVSGYAAPSANYALAQPSGLTASVTARPLTIGGAFTASSKVHDGTTAATIASSALTLAGVVAGDAVSLTGVTAAFASASVGTAKPVSITAASLTGAAAANYALSLVGAPTTPPT
jgi:hypothetical protein